jgi:long-subunit fatty acid transport protein
MWRVFAQYDFSEYSKDQNLNSSILTSSGGSIPASLALNWNNMSNYRFATEVKALLNWVFRLGYVYTSQVTPKGDAKALMPAPGNSNTFTWGAGYEFSEALRADVAFEYSKASGSVTATEAGSAGSTTRAGDYSSSAYGVLLGVTYRIL